MSKETKDVAVQVAEFPALQQDPGELREALLENLGGAGLSPFDLDRIGIPAGGGLAWTVPTLEGETSSPEVLGIIVGIQNARAYWATPFGSGAGDMPPDCTSDDAVYGVGTPGGECKECPYAAFGSDSRSRGQACKLIQRHFVLRAGDNLPVTINLPPGSLKGARKYLLRLVSAGLKASAVVTRYTLEKDKNQDGITYSRAVFAVAGRLTPEQAAAAGAFGKALAPAFKQVRADDFTTAPEETY